MIASSDLGKAEVLNTYFYRVFTKEVSTNIPSFDPIENVPQMMDIIVTEDDVLSKLLALMKSQSAGPDGIHTHMLREVEHAVRVSINYFQQFPLWLFYSYCLEGGQYCANF